MRECLVIDIVTAEDICNEHSMEFALFKLLSQFYPVLDRVEICRSIVWVFPETRALMTGAFTLLSAIVGHRNNHVDFEDIHISTKAFSTRRFLGRPSPLTATCGDPVTMLQVRSRRFQ